MRQERFDRSWTRAIDQVHALLTEGLPVTTAPSLDARRYWVCAKQMAKTMDDGGTLVREDSAARGSDFNDGLMLPRNIKEASGYS